MTSRDVFEGFHPGGENLTPREVLLDGAALLTMAIWGHSQRAKLRHSMRQAEQVYVRQLPGGGFVAIEAAPFRNILGQRRYRGAVRVERRAAADRRAGHRAPVIASTEAATVGTVLHDLFPIAQSNIVIATKCLAAASGPRRGEPRPERQRTAAVVPEPANGSPR